MSETLIAKNKDVMYLTERGKESFYSENQESIITIKSIEDGKVHASLVEYQKVFLNETNHDSLNEYEIIFPDSFLLQSNSTKLNEMISLENFLLDEVLVTHSFLSRYGCLLAKGDIERLYSNHTLEDILVLIDFKSKHWLPIATDKKSFHHRRIKYEIALLNNLHEYKSLNKSFYPIDELRSELSKNLSFKDM